MHDMVIRGGTIVDGTGADPLLSATLAHGQWRQDCTRVGGTAGPGKKEYDATGKLVTPGWVDVHTHYDGQATWDPHAGAVLLAWRDHGPVRQLRRRLRPVPARRTATPWST